MKNLKKRFRFRFREARSELVWTLIQNEEGILFEITEGESYLRRHLPGAVQLSLSQFCNEILDRVSDFDSVIVCYGHNESDWKAKCCAQFASALGYRNVFWYSAGKEGWVKRGLPVETLIYKHQKVNSRPRLESLKWISGTWDRPHEVNLVA